MHVFFCHCTFLRWTTCIDVACGVTSVESVAGEIRCTLTTSTNHTACVRRRDDAALVKAKPWECQRSPVEACGTGILQTAVPHHTFSTVGCRTSFWVLTWGNVCFFTLSLRSSKKKPAKKESILVSVIFSFDCIPVLKLITLTPSWLPRSAVTYT